ncbi:MAG: PTS glucose transporter subunit IIA [Bdellovibrionales bacterium CG10_big_fil_rev_8_21_14_0_10_45_34]|nr:MAG: PTS glucose transporter subunit IIA [Bdellovibrionales bacterium CG10_big_fil_rev_8_21_14_0_10_45_34]
MNRFGSVFATLQKVGQSLMVPVSVLPAAGLLVALGRLLTDFAESSGAEAGSLIHAIGQICFSGGLAIFEQLPVVFAIGVAIGFTGGAGVAGLASVVGYFTMVNVLKVVGTERGLEQAINTGVFGGIIIGLLSARLYTKYHQTRLHPVFGFFAGKRLVPIITAALAIVVALALGFVWPPIQDAINSFGQFVMGSDFGPAFYAAGKRLLIPVGLHHVYYPPFLYEFGEYMTQAGQMVKGETARYFAGDPTAGRFMASEFPIMLFGLPAATLAMYLRAKPARKKAVAGVMFSAALTSIITGITEPIEFAFIFVAPVLYLFHVAAAFASGLLTAAFDIHLGYTFSASLIDYVIGFFNQHNSLYLWIVVGPAIFALYFGVFYWLIKALDLKTPGREDETLTEDVEAIDTRDRSAKAVGVLEALGGPSNLKHIDACITRLRLQVNNPAKVNKEALKSLGATGTMDAGGGNIQVVFGVESDHLKDEIQRIISDGPQLSQTVSSGSENKTQTFSRPTPSARLDIETIFAPMRGRVIRMSDVPDETFSQKILGEGIAIEPVNGEVFAPVTGVVSQMFRTGHAIGFTSESGLEVLVHVGIDTVKLNGEGFNPLIKKGDAVTAGDLILKFDLAKISQKAKSTITPIVITNMGLVKSIDFTKSGSVKENEKLMEIQL